MGKVVVARILDLYNGHELDCALEIMTALENGTSIKDAKKCFLNKIIHL